jgi:Uma2 family endonuclease
MGAKTLLTVEHLDRLPETGDVFYELEQGELVEVSSAGYIYHRIRGRVERFLRVQSADTVRAPGLALVSPSQLPLLDLERRVQPFSPALAIEITSPSNTFDELARKTQQYLEGGIRAMWILVTAMRQIHVYSATAHPVVLTAEDRLEDAALLPGFSARVEELFAV